MLEKIRLHEILTVMYVMIGKKLPTELEHVTTYTPEVEAVLLKNNWTLNAVYQDYGQRCIGFVTENKTNSFVIENIPDSTRWQATMVFFEPWPENWTSAHKIGFFCAYDVQLTEKQLELYPGMPMCIMHLFDDKIVIGRFFFQQLSMSMKSSKLMFDLIAHFGVGFVNVTRQSKTTLLHTHLFLNHCIAFQEWKKNPVDSN